MKNIYKCATLFVCLITILVAFLIVYWCKTTFTTNDLLKIIQSKPQNYQDYSEMYNQIMWGDVPSSEKILENPELIFEKFNENHLHEDIIWNGSVGQYANIQYEYSIFSARGYLNVNPYTPDLALFDKDLNLVGWVLTAHTQELLVKGRIDIVPDF